MLLTFLFTALGFSKANHKIPTRVWGGTHLRAQKIYSCLTQGLKYIALRTYSIATIFSGSNMLATKRLQNELSRRFLCVFTSIILDFQFYTFNVLKNGCTVHHFFILSLTAFSLQSNHIDYKTIECK